MMEPKDDGESSDWDEDELEEGELNDDIGRSKADSTAKQTCSSGQCFFAQNCRFGHVNVASGNYCSMLAPSISATRVPYSSYFDPAHGIMSHRSGLLPLRPEFVSSLPVCSPSIPSEESSWERVLQTAKELVLEANKRKIEDADISEESLSLSPIVNEKNVPEYIDSDSNYKKKRIDVPYPNKEGEFVEGGRIEDIDRTMENQKAECESPFAGERLQPRNQLLAALVLTAIAFHPKLMREYGKLMEKWLKEVAESCLKRVKLPVPKYFDAERVSKLIIPSLDMVEEIKRDAKHTSGEPYLKLLKHKKIALEAFRKIFSEVVIPIFIIEEQLTEEEVECVESFWEYQDEKTTNP